MKKDEEELHEMVNNYVRWKHFLQTLRKPYIWVPLIIIIVYLKESHPIHIPIIDHILKLIAFKAGVR